MTSYSNPLPYDQNGGSSSSTANWRTLAREQPSRSYHTPPQQVDDDEEEEDRFEDASDEPPGKVQAYGAPTTAPAPAATARWPSSGAVSEFASRASIPSSASYSSLRGNRAPAPAALDLSPRSERVYQEQQGQRRVSRPLPSIPKNAPPPRSSSMATVPLSAVGSGLATAPPQTKSTTAVPEPIPSPYSPEINPSEIDRGKLIGTGELATPRWSTAPIHALSSSAERVPPVPFSHSAGKSPPKGLGLGVGGTSAIKEDSLLSLNSLADFDFDSSMTSALAASLSVPDDLAPKKEYRQSAPAPQTQNTTRWDQPSFSPGSARSRIYARRQERQSLLMNEQAGHSPATQYAPANANHSSSAANSPPNSADPYARKKTPPQTTPKAKQSSSPSHHDILRSFAPKDFSHLPPSPSSASINQFLRGSGSVNNFAAFGTPKVNRSDSGHAPKKEKDPEREEALRKLDGLSSTPGKKTPKEKAQTSSASGTPMKSPPQVSTEREQSIPVAEAAAPQKLPSEDKVDSPLSNWVDLAEDLPLAAPPAPKRLSKAAELVSPKRDSSSSTSLIGTPNSRDSLPTSTTTPSSAGKAARRISGGSVTSIQETEVPEINVPPVPPLPKSYRSPQAESSPEIHSPVSDVSGRPRQMNKKWSFHSALNLRLNTQTSAPGSPNLSEDAPWSEVNPSPPPSSRESTTPVGQGGQTLTLPKAGSSRRLTPSSIPFFRRTSSSSISKPEPPAPAPQPQQLAPTTSRTSSGSTARKSVLGMSIPSVLRGTSKRTVSQQLPPTVEINAEPPQAVQSASVGRTGRKRGNTVSLSNDPPPGKMSAPPAPPLAEERPSRSYIQPQTSLPTVQTPSRSYASPPEATTTTRSYVSPPDPTPSRSYVSPPNSGSPRQYVSPPVSTPSRSYMSPPETASSRSFSSAMEQGVQSTSQPSSQPSSQPGSQPSSPPQRSPPQQGGYQQAPSQIPRPDPRPTPKSKSSTDSSRGYPSAEAVSKAHLPSIAGSPSVRHAPSMSSLRDNSIRESPRTLPSATPTKIPRAIARTTESPARGSMPPPSAHGSTKGSMTHKTASSASISEFGTCANSTPRQQVTSSSHRARLLAPMSSRKEARENKQYDPLVRSIGGQVIPPSRRHLPLPPSSSVTAPTAASLAKRASREAVRVQGQRSTSGSDGGQRTPSETGGQIKPSKSLHTKLATASATRLPSSSSVGAQSKTSLVDTPSPMEDDEVQADAEMAQYVKRRQARHAAGKKEDLTDINEFPEDISPTSPISQRAFISKNLAQMSDYERKEVLDFDHIYYTPSTRINRGPQPDGKYYNNGYDDERGDYVVVKGDHLCYRYEVMGVLGKGSFGQVVQCRDHRTGGSTAIKIIRNKSRFHKQALVEVKILKQLVDWDPEDRHFMVRMTDHFYFRGHLCIVTEMLSINLYELIKANQFAGFSTVLIRRFTVQMLASLQLLRSHRVVHCDLKPENILLCHPRKSGIKVIDFGSSCHESEKVYTYIQSRFYRSPEVILGMNYAMAIDMWSIGCILAELYTGVPLFPGEDEAEQLACIMEVIGVPERYIVEKASRRKVFFDSMGMPRPHVNAKGKRRRPGAKSLAGMLKCDDELFVDFIAKCLTWDPDKRLKPQPALRHPWILAGRRRQAPTAPSASQSTPRPHRVSDGGMSVGGNGNGHGGSASHSGNGGGGGGGAGRAGVGAGGSSKSGLVISPPTPLMARSSVGRLVGYQARG